MKFFRYIVLSILFGQKSLEKSWGLCYNIIVKKSDLRYDETSNNCNNPSEDCWRCDNGLAAPPTCLMTSRTSSLELRLNNDKLNTLYCSQCMSSTHEKGIFTHLYNHHG